MKPPKRSPFLRSRQAELLEVYRHLYPDPQAPFSAKGRHDALSTVQLWINRSACPFAVETTALLVQSVILDEHMQQIASSSFSRDSASIASPRYALEQMGGGAELGVRLNYSLALTRFVNSVVDSHQTGGFAQSIAAIAARIGLPQWFVEIRHAVTHEELPSINVCRQAAGQALVWLRRHFWAPQLFEGPNRIRFGNGPHNQDAMDVDQAEHPNAEASSSAIQMTAKEKEAENTRKRDCRKALQDIRQTLKDYRSLSKRVTRDRSLANKSKDQFSRLYKQVSGFVYRIRTLDPGFGAQLASDFKKGKDEEVDVRNVAMMDPDDVDECTKSALASLINQLMQPGGLVPMKRSKRVQDQEMILTSELASLWTPLLGYLRDTYGPVFGQMLAEELVEAAVREIDLVEDASERLDEVDVDSDSDVDDHSWKAAACSEPSYRKTADAWLRYLVTTIPPPLSTSASANRPAAPLITDAEVAELCLPLRVPASTSILEFLCERNTELKTRIGPLLDVLKVSAFVAAIDPNDQVVETVTEAMEEEDSSGFASQLEAMQRRLVEMEAVKPGDSVGSGSQRGEEREVDAQTDTQVEALVVDTGTSGNAMANKMPKGWSMAGADWKPTPFGCLNGKVPHLIV